MFGIVMCLSIFIILTFAAFNNRRKTKEMLIEEMQKTVNKKSDEIINSCEIMIDSIDNNK